MSDDILRRVGQCLCRVLALEPSQVLPESRLMGDLGAESLDLVELMFVLEQEFNITLSEEDLSLSAQLGLTEDEIHQNEVLTPKALEILRERFPWAEKSLVDGTTRRRLADLLTVEEVARSVGRKLEADGAAA